MLAIELIIRLLTNVEKEISDYFSLDAGEQSEVSGVIMGLSKAKGHAKVVSALQVCNEESR